MQDPAYGLRRTPLPRARVNRDKKKEGRGASWPFLLHSLYGSRLLSGSFYNRDEAIGLYQPPHNSL